MPPKVRFIKEQIIEAAISIIKSNGCEALSMKNIA